MALDESHEDLSVEGNIHKKQSSSRAVSEKNINTSQKQNTFELH